MAFSVIFWSVTDVVCFQYFLHCSKIFSLTRSIIRTYNSGCVSPGGWSCRSKDMLMVDLDPQEPVVRYCA